MSDNTPLYNLKAVIHEVGLSPATLRAWERRYDVLKPQRSSGGHRLYSRQDIELLRWLVQRQNEGLRISRAVEMWKAMDDDALRTLQQSQGTVPVLGTGETVIKSLRGEWIAACMAYDNKAANQVLDQAFAIEAPEMICTEILQKGLSQIGDGWYAGSISVQQEHFASSVAIRRINALMAAVQAPTRSGSILAACPPGEEHDFILLLVAYLLKRTGWDVVYLGSNVPLVDLNTTIHNIKPILILSEAQTLNTAASLRAMAEFAVTQGVPLAYGGGVFNLVPNAIQRVSGYYLGSNITGIPSIIERLVTATPPMPTAQPLSLEYELILAKFAENTPVIHTYMTSRMKSEPFLPAHLEIANGNLTKLISSALAMGDINLADHDLRWLNGLLNNHGLTTSAVQRFYVTYHQALESYLGKDGRIITDWLIRVSMINTTA